MIFYFFSAKPISEKILGHQLQAKMLLFSQISERNQLISTFFTGRQSVQVGSKTYYY